MPALEVDLPAEIQSCFGQQPIVGSHRLQEHELFTDTALIDLLDHFPRRHLYALNMGTDPTRVEENRLALHDGVSGAELLQAVSSGRLWLNVTRVDRADARYRRLISDLVEELGTRVPGFSPHASQGTLLLSSPTALVYYHADGPPSVLWHVRGRKRIWVYPALDERYLKRELLEDIFAGVRHEYLPYQPGFDEGARVFDLEPGQWISWPQNAPHRVTNLDSVNVSLTTEYFTRASQQRFQLYLANRFFRTRLGCTKLSTREVGAMAVAKTVAQRAARRMGLNPLKFRHQIPVLRVVATAPGGVVELDPANTLATGSGP